MVDAERGYFLHVEPVDILLEQAEQGQVERCQSGLLALKYKYVQSEEILKRTATPG